MTSAEFLLELFCEEIPAGMQGRGAADLDRLITEGLAAAGLDAEGVTAYAGPRRLTLHIEKLATATNATREERKGPKQGAPEKAIEGFLRSVGLSSLEETELREDKKGAFHVAVIEHPSRPTTDILAELIPDVIARFPWPKSMRWGAGSLRWVRPLHGILCLFEGKVVPVEVEGIKASAITHGHRFMAPGAVEVSGFADYRDKLRERFVILEAVERERLIADGAEKLAREAGLELVPDDALIREIAGLVEWPVPLIGSIDEAFLAVPEEVLTSTMAANQRYLALKDPKTGKLAARFIVVANIAAKDGGAAVTDGNERVLRARFSDAQFLWDQDKQHTLASRLEKLEAVTFYDRLGTMAEKARHLGAVSRHLARTLQVADPDLALEAGRLAKADLVTGMVYEFPELQGIMGGHYAAAEGLGEEIATALAEHYRPLGPQDALPSTDLGRLVSLADKLVTLVGFFGIDEKPTGSRDPYALRRAALGVIRIVLASGYRLRLKPLFETVFGEYVVTRPGELDRKELKSLLAFFADRLKVHLRDAGARHDLVDAVFALPDQDDLVAIVARVDALSAFLASDDGANLIAGYRRASNILRIEEKKDGREYDGEPDPALFDLAEEKALADAIEAAAPRAREAVKQERYEDAMATIAALRAPVDAFFDGVTVNADDEKVRANRLALLGRIRSALEEVADFSRLEG